MEQIMRRLIVLVALGLATAAQAASPSPATVELSFAGVETGKGAVMFALFDSEDGYNGKAAPVRSLMVPATAETVTTTLAGLAPGRYAVKAYYDVNGNGKMDTNPFGMPVEPFAFSNNAKGAMGPALWADAAFDVAAGSSRHAISFR
jgi:uncharacterized protein (DUF2141 family)